MTASQDIHATTLPTQDYLAVILALETSTHSIQAEYNRLQRQLSGSQGRRAQDGYIRQDLQRLQLVLENNQRALQQAREQARATVQAGERAA